MINMENKYAELKGLSEALNIRAGSLVKVLIQGNEIKGVLGLYANNVSDILTLEEVRGVSFYWGESPKPHEPHFSLEWYQRNRKDIAHRLKLLEAVK